MSKSDLMALAALIVVAPRYPAWVSYLLGLFFLVASFWYAQ